MTIYPYLTRDEIIKRIKAALKAKTGRTWSVTGGRGTSWGWITVEAQPKDRVCHDENPAYDWRDPKPGISCSIDRKPNAGEIGYYTSEEDRKVLAQAFGLDRPVHHQGLSISPDDRGWHLEQVEKGL